MRKDFIRKLGKSGIQVSPLGLGCWAIGGPFKMFGVPDGWGEIDDGESKKAIHTALELGINFFDTADAYGTGHSEEILGEALKGKRNEAVIATKFGYTYDEAARELNGEDSSPEYIRKACEASLRRLKTDYIDLYQLHRWSIPDEEIDPVIETLEKLKSEGLIRAYGWSTDKADSAAIFAERSNCSVFQQCMNIFWHEPKVLELCEKYDLASINRSPLAMGLLSGKFDANSTLPGNDVRGQTLDWLSYFKNGKPVKEYLDKLESVKEILRSNGRTPAQGSLAWIWAKSEKTIPIPGFKNVRQVQENAKAMEFGPLTREQMLEIEKILAS